MGFSWVLREEHYAALRQEHYAALRQEMESVMGPEIKIATLPGVREYNEREPVELWFRGGRVILRAFNECHNNHTDVDLGDLIECLQSRPGLVENAGNRISSSPAAE